jgi:uncharacterized protein (DUF58 family)
MPQLDVSQWLEQLHTDGISLGMQELMYYRSKIAAFAKHKKTLPRTTVSGPLLSKVRGRGMEFDEVRHYQAGDDIRAIDWRVTARTGKAHTKLYREEKEKPVFIWVDLSLSQLFGSEFVFKSVQAAHLAAAIAWQAQHKGDRVGGLISNGWLHNEFKPAARQQGVLRLLHGLVDVSKDSLARWQKQASTPAEPMSESLKRLRQLVKPGSIIHVISDFHNADKSIIDGLQVLSKHNLVRCYGVYDPMEKALPQGHSIQPLAVSNGQQQVDIDLTNKRQTETYANAAQSHWQALEKSFANRQLLFTPVSSAQPIEVQWSDIS